MRNLPLFPASGDFLPGLSRRQFAAGALAVAAWSCWPAGKARAQGAPGFQVSPWRGPVGAFSLPDLAGKIWTAADLPGRAVLLNFWASWCEPCQAEMPALQQLADRYGPEKLLVLAINFKEAPQVAIRFANSTGLRTPVLLDRGGAAARRWGVKVFPTTLLLDHRGKPQQVVRGEMDWTSLEAAQLVGRLLAP